MICRSDCHSDNYVYAHIAIYTSNLCQRRWAMCIGEYRYIAGKILRNECDWPMIYKEVDIITSSKTQESLKNKGRNEYKNLINGRSVWNVDSWAWQDCCTQTHKSYNYLHKISTALVPTKFWYGRGLLRGVTTPWQEKIRKGEPFSSVVNPLTKCYTPVKNPTKTHWVTKEFRKVEVKIVGKMKGTGNLSRDHSGKWI